MIRRALNSFSGDALRARALRGTALTFASFGGTNFLRLGSNLILTRLLFPEAFGLMALVQVFMSGLQMFSNIGIRTSVIQNARGDDEDFLNTAWTIQVLRGAVLWLAACALAVPASRLYEEPLLAQMLPIVGLTALIAGFTTTKVHSANRHLILGRITVLELSIQAVSICVTIILAFMMRSVWALVIGGVISSLIHVVVTWNALPGIRNRFFIDRSAFSDIFHFGKYIFLSTVAGFAINQGDRAILGGYVSLAELGIYSIGFFLGTVPLLFSGMISRKVVFPLYRMRPPTESAENQAQIFKARRLVVGGSMLLTFPLAIIGIPLVEFLYDPRYHLAGPIVTLFCLAAVPQIIVKGYGGILLAHGDSKRHFVLLTLTAMAQLTLLFTGVIWAGLFGAILATGLAVLLTYPLGVFFINRYNAWDSFGELSFMALGLGINGLICWWNWEQIAQLIS